MIKNVWKLKNCLIKMNTKGQKRGERILKKTVRKSIPINGYRLN